MDWVHLEETDSTNRVAKELARQGAPHGTVVSAKRQTAGRGRLGRRFCSPEGGIYLSVLLRTDLPPEDRALLTPMAAVAVCRSGADRRSPRLYGRIPRPQSGAGKGGYGSSHKRRTLSRQGTGH